MTTEERLIMVLEGFVCLFLIDSPGKDCCVWWEEQSVTMPRLTA